MGIKLGLLVSSEVLTETRRASSHVASSWSLTSRYRAPWKRVPPPGLGTHKGVGVKRITGGFLVGAQPTGKRFEVQHIHWYRVRDGKITDHFTNRDDLGMTQQLGLLPTGNR